MIAWTGATRADIDPRLRRGGRSSFASRAGVPRGEVWCRCTGAPLAPRARVPNAAPPPPAVRAPPAAASASVAAAAQREPRATVAAVDERYGASHQISEGARSGSPCGFNESMSFSRVHCRSRTRS